MVKMPKPQLFRLGLGLTRSKQLCKMRTGPGHWHRNPHPLTLGQLLLPQGPIPPPRPLWVEAPRSEVEQVRQRTRLV